MSQFLTLDDVKNICYEYAKAHLTFDEPIPSFETRFANQLETALAAPQRSAYPTIHQQGAVLFYELIKLHPFLNGNKRIACVSLMVFLQLNDAWLKASWRELYDIAITVANSRTENREGLLRLLTDFIKNNLGM
ncbi:MAG: hypothetical protein A2445_03650 [Candidatus Jacksonbacteria bacterium RIFOXYC2_FULL_44_29]|nr:MAG: Death-on-curing family protein [Parcubacteria group bacterium GW2011_GWA2_42_28]KKT53822.1 MAG: Death-on-curing family protein [Parcubacteria group bacterium GW2011_GWC2_44_22]OGY76747.1 MAG: hypothetical protein A2240_00835 [Candidatus Jacksonbacteria bacterium RIFOXYA2_FULL_43_12]OGY77323.1 MAG: hypothetical protein A2295_03745 [Candidatus Jacksonbacteria bacterium RIFOXYB2_FULL_44_15]OGY79077.1 MAG: hypothetical protein A2550_04640 [Candidatus Jacksonbacteria bacterium RIFOXYD2_FULL_